MGSTIDDSLKKVTGRPTLKEDWNEKEDCKRRFKFQDAFEIVAISEFWNLAFVYEEKIKFSVQ